MLKEWEVGSRRKSNAESEDGKRKRVWKGTRAGRLNKNKGELYSLIKAPIEFRAHGLARASLQRTSTHTWPAQLGPEHQECVWESMKIEGRRV